MADSNSSNRQMLWSGKHFERRIKSCEAAFDAGSHVAAYDAVHLCHMHSKPLPNWLVVAVLQSLEASFKTGTKGKRGRASRPEKAFEEDMKHYMRWDAVCDLRDRKDELADIASTWEQRFAAVSDLLEGTSAEGSEETIKRSYQLVERLMKTNKAGRFFIPRNKPG